MPLFIVFVVASVMLGAGAMLSPAWDTKQPRIGLAAAFSLALVLGGAVFWAEAFGPDLLVIDYLLFALVSFVVLGGTLSQAQARAEARGETLADEDQGWTSRRDLMFFLVAGILFLVPVLMLPVPAGETAVSTAYLTLTAREGLSFSNLAPFYPDVTVLHMPGFHALTAYLSEQLEQAIPVVQFGVAAVVSLMSVWVMYDLGGELLNKRNGRTMAVSLLAGGGIIGMFLTGQFTALIGVLFALAFMIYALRYLRQAHWMDLVAGGLMLGAVLYATPTLFMVLSGAYALWLVTMWFVPDKLRPDMRHWMGLAGGIPLVAILGTLPWLLNNLSLLSLEIASPYERSLSYLMVIVQHHGIWTIPLAAVGAWTGWQGAQSGVRQMIVWCGGWLLLVVDLSVVGILPGLLPVLDRFLMPLDIAWFGSLIPLTILSGMGLLWLWDTVVPATLRESLTNAAEPMLVVGGIVMLGGVLLPGFLAMSLSPLGLDFQATEADVEVMNWLRENAAPEARILNHPVEGVWAAPYTERDAVYFPLLFVYEGTGMIATEQGALAAFWDDPAGNAEAVQAAGIDYVLVPQIINAPEQVNPDLHRLDAEVESVAVNLEDVPYLERVFAFEGAVVYAVQESSEGA